MRTSHNSNLRRYHYVPREYFMVDRLRRREIHHAGASRHENGLSGVKFSCPLALTLNSDFATFVRLCLFHQTRWLSGLIDPGSFKSWNFHPPSVAQYVVVWFTNMHIVRVIRFRLTHSPSRLHNQQHPAYLVHSIANLDNCLSLQYFHPPAKLLTTVSTFMAANQVVYDWSVIISCVNFRRVSHYACAWFGLEEYTTP